MKNFRFRLETLLRLRKNSRDRALSDYALSIRDREVAEKKVVQADLYLDRLNDILIEKSQNVFLGSEILAFQEQIRTAKTSKNNLVKNLSKLKTLEDSRRRVFVQKESEFKSLENYKNRKSDEHFHCEFKKEEKAQEDIISSRFVFSRVHS